MFIEMNSKISSVSLSASLKSVRKIKKCVLIFWVTMSSLGLKTHNREVENKLRDTLELTDKLGYFTFAIFAITSTLGNSYPLITIGIQKLLGIYDSEKEYNLAFGVMYVIHNLIKNVFLICL